MRFDLTEQKRGKKNGNDINYLGEQRLRLSLGPRWTTRGEISCFFYWNWSMQEFIFYQRFELLKQKREKKNQKITTRWEKIKDDVNDLGEHVLLLSLRARWATRKGFHETERYINCVAIRDLARRSLSAEENWKIMFKMWMNRNLFYVWRLKKEAQEVKFQLEMIWKELVLEFRLTDHERGEKLKKLYQ